MNFNKKYENLRLMLLRILVGIRIRDPGVQTGSGSQPVKIPGSDRIRIRNTGKKAVFWIRTLQIAVEKIESGSQ